MSVLVDSSVWIAYFRGDETASEVDRLIEENLLVTNNLILAELIPSLEVRGEIHLIDLLKNIEPIPLEIDWNHLIELQVKCLQNGLNRVGIPDLIIAQQAMRVGLELCTLDKHFHLMSEIVELEVF
ncbi:MAG: PIN domain-containing protein [Candidatus Omnitrophica bacterium]|nr:PIN domain-containing protein [Candidatus Omnitrophota bacterium]